MSDQRAAAGSLGVVSARTGTRSPRSFARLSRTERRGRSVDAGSAALAGSGRAPHARCAESGVRLEGRTAAVPYGNPGKTLCGMTSPW